MNTRQLYFDNYRYVVVIINTTCTRRRRSGWNSGVNAWQALKVGWCRVGWGIGRDVPSPAD